MHNINKEMPSTPDKERPRGSPARRMSAPHRTRGIVAACIMAVMAACKPDVEQCTARLEEVMESLDAVQRGKNCSVALSADALRKGIGEDCNKLLTRTEKDAMYYRELWAYTGKRADSLCPELVRQRQEGNPQ